MVTRNLGKVQEALTALNPIQRNINELISFTQRLNSPNHSSDACVRALNAINTLNQKHVSSVNSLMFYGNSYQDIDRQLATHNDPNYNVNRVARQEFIYTQAAQVAMLPAVSTLGTQQTQQKRWWQSNIFKFTVGALVVVGAAVAVVATGGAALAVGALVGSAVGAVAGGAIGGAMSAASGGSFWDGAANGVMWGSISGAVSGMIGAAIPSSGFLVHGAMGLADGGIYVAQSLFDGKTPTVAGFATTVAISTGLSFGISRLTASITKPKTIQPTTNNQITVNNSRPTWRQSEIDAASRFTNFDAQISFKRMPNGTVQQVPYGTPGSVRPDFYRPGFSIDVKNYNVSTPAGRNNLINNIADQYQTRLINLPQGTQQTILIDIRGQSIDRNIQNMLKDDIISRTGVNLDILFQKR